MTLKTLLPILTLALAITTSAQKTIPNTTGVSKQLADWRQKTISQINYTLHINIPTEKDHAITGEEVITFQLADTSQPLSIDFKATPKQLQSLTVNDTPTPIVFEKEHLLISQNVLQKGKNNIKITFTTGDAALTRNPDFLYTFFVPERARTFFPCFDQPNLKATLTLTATAPSDWEVISNGKLLDKKTIDTKTQCTFATSDAISTYLFSIVAGKFQKETRTINNREVTLYYRETNAEKIAESLTPIFELHQKALQFLEAYTGIAYPFQKFDCIALPGFQAGGMEHVGAIDYREASLFLDKSASPKQKIDRIQLIAHETAHMWFGNLVTMKWFNDVWMKEVFANFMADKLTNNLEPNNPADFQFLMAHYPSAYAVDRTTGSHPIRQALANLNQAGSLYGNIIYDKAPIAMQQLETLVGPAAFQQAIQAYLAKYAHGNADWNDLIVLLQNATKEDLTTWNTNWINKAGRPVISYNLEQQHGKITKLTLHQQGEHNQKGIWQQRFTIALVYANETITIPIAMNHSTETIKEALGRKTPVYILFNASGNGYGNFPIDQKMLPLIATIPNAVSRASAYLNLYENMVNGKIVTPTTLIALYEKNLALENEPLLLERLKRQFQNTYWQYLTPAQRQKESRQAEKSLLTALTTATDLPKKRTLFQWYTAIALSPEAVDNLYHYWETKTGPANIPLTEDDLTALASELALRNHSKTTSVLETQYTNIENSDSKAKFKYLVASLSNNSKIRDAYFATLPTDLKNEDWIATALAYLNHPLRAPESEKYITPTLALLPQMQATGGVFFPQSCLSATIGSYQSKSAATKVRQFLKTHPKYNSNLKKKILQEADDLFRAEKIIGTR